MKLLQEFTMPIAGSKPLAEPVVKQDLPRIEPENYKGIIYDNNHTPLQNLISFIGGMPWTVDFYRQVVAKHNDLKDLDDEQAAQYQQYYEFKNLEIRVDSDLKSSHNSDTGLTEVVGSSFCYPFTQVNAGDVFVANTGSNRSTIFRITDVNRNTFNRDSAYEISYTLVAYADQKPELLKTLKEKTQKTYYFSKDRLLEGLQPFIASEEYHNVTNIKVVLDDIVRYYFKNMFNQSFSTLVLPGQEKVIFDSNLAAYVMKFVTGDDAPEVRRVKLVPNDNDVYLSQPEFWKLLFARDYDGLTRCNDEMSLVSKYMFNNNTYLSGFRYSNIDYLVYPDTADESLDIQLSPGPRKLVTMEEIVDTTPFKGHIYSDVDNLYADGLRTYQIIHEVLVDRKYVLSEAFYNGTDQQSLLEILTKDYMKHQFIDLKKLYACCNVYKKWKRLEQYYYGPILITLLLDAYRAQYT